MASKAKRTCRFCGVEVVPGLLVCGQCSLEREQRAEEQREREAQWQERDVARRAGPQLLAALQVLVLTPGTRRWLAMHDPKALEQARAAIEAAGGQAYPLDWVAAEERGWEAAGLAEAEARARAAARSERCGACGEFLGDWGACVTVGCGGECQIEAGTDCAWYCTTHDRRMGGNVAVRPASCPQGDDPRSWSRGAR